MSPVLFMKHVGDQDPCTACQLMSRREWILVVGTAAEPFNGFGFGLPELAHQHRG